MNLAKKIAQAARDAAKKKPEVMGLDHPEMTREKAVELLPDGVLVPLPLLYRLAPLCNPMEYRSLPNGVLMDLADSLNRLLDAALRTAQEKSLKETGKPRPPA